MVVKVEVFTSDSCPHCPAAVNVANEAKEVLGDAADIIVCNIASEENRQKAIGLGIMAVPTIAINDEVAFVGAPALDELVNKVKSFIFKFMFNIQEKFINCTSGCEFEPWLERTTGEARQSPRRQSSRYRDCDPCGPPRYRPA